MRTTRYVILSAAKDLIDSSAYGLRMTAFPFLFLFYFFFLSFDFSFADTSSTNYAVESEAQTAGSASAITSADYKLEENAVDWLAKDLATSTNYKVEGKIGVSALPAPPIFNSATPGNLARYFTDENASYVVSATSPDAGSLEYKAKQDGTLKDGPQASSTLTWAHVTADKGRRTDSFEVSHTNGTVRQDQAKYVFRRPIK